MHIRWRGLELPSLVVCDRESLTPTYGRFTVEPFEVGFGVTVGNAIRRVLLSSLEGSAVTQIKIHGAEHEFTTIPGVREDVTDIVLNVKSLIVKNHGDSTRVMTVEKEGPGLVTGADVQTDSEVDVINRDYVLATLTSDIHFTMEMVVENGRGFVPATENSMGEHEIGIIPIDAAFSPVTRVRYEVEPTCVGERTHFERVMLEIWTNGSISPEMALIEAAKIFRKHLNPFISYVEQGSRLPASRQAGSRTVESSLEPKLRMSLSELKLSVRAMNCLEAEDINTVGDLVQRTEEQLLEVRNFGENTLVEVKQKLEELDLHLGMKVSSSLGR
jgi:DNA-directed RNA polymerase subunit alpha